MRFLTTAFFATLLSLSAFAQTTVIGGKFEINPAKESGLIQIAVTEINYNSDNLNESNDWVELHNYGNSSVDISSWKLKDETAFNSYTIPSETILEPGEFLVLVEDLDTFPMVHPEVTNIVGPFNFGFDNTSGGVKIEDNLGNVIKYISYVDSVPWPKGCDGFGPTLQIIDETGDENDPANWIAGCVLGTPGAPYVPCDYPVIINEINYNSLAAYSPGDWIEIWNRSASTVDMSGWILKDMNNGNAFLFPNGTSLEPDIRMCVSDSLSSFTVKFPWATNVIGEPDFHFSNGGDAIRLYDATGKIKFSVRYNDKAPWPTDADGLGFTLESVNFGDNPNIATNWVAGCMFGTPGFWFSLPCGDQVEEIEPVSPIAAAPNPFNGSVEIQITYPAQISTAFISDIAGNKIATLNTAGPSMTWNGVNDKNSSVAAGIYFVNVITTDGKRLTTQIIKVN